MKNVFYLLLSLSICILSYGMYNAKPIEFIESNEQFLLSRSTDNVFVIVKDGKIVKCDRGALSNLVLAMKEDGYELTTSSSKGKELDLVLTKGDEIQRIVFNENGKFENFSNPYEKRYILTTYINERIYQE